jgi:hypothetical protein
MPSKKKKPSEGESVDDWVTQTDAAKARGVSLSVVANWLARGRLKNSKVEYGKNLVSLSEVLNYQPLTGGWPKGVPRSRKASKKSRPN